MILSYCELVSAFIVVLCCCYGYLAFAPIVILYLLLSQLYFGLLCGYCGWAK